MHYNSNYEADPGSKNAGIRNKQNENWVDFSRIK